MKLKRSKAPLPGAYTGKVDGFPALLVVTTETVEATWRSPRATAFNGFTMVDNSWSVDKGTFCPTHRGELLKVIFNKASRMPPDGEE